MKKICLFLVCFIISCSCFSENSDLYVFDQLKKKFYLAKYNSEKKRWYPEKVTLNSSKGMVSSPANQIYDQSIQKGAKTVGRIVKPAIIEDKYTATLDLYPNSIIGSKNFNDIFQAYVCNYKGDCNTIAGTLVQFDNVQNFWDNKEFQILSKTQIEHGKKNGEQKVYSNGKLIEVTTYQNDVENGKILQYYENGNLKWEGNYKNGKLNGVDRFFYPEGGLSVESIYKDNVHNGEVKTFYPSGKLQVKGILKNGIMYNGKVYDEAGKVIKTISGSPFVIKY